MSKEKNLKSEEQDSVITSKMSVLKAAMQKIEKDYGKGSIMKLGDGPIEKPSVISTGCLSLNNALGVGGLPRGRIIEIFGPEMSGKSTVAMQIIAQAQKLGGICAYVDAEQAMDLSYASKIGVDVANLLLSQPDWGEQALGIVEDLVVTAAVDVIVVDSVAALTPKSEIEGEFGVATMGAQARLMGQAMRKLTSTVAKTRTILIFINQLRQKIGVMFGNPETTTGGNALKFYASVRLDVRRIEIIKDKDEVIGGKTRIKVVKNKVAPPFKETIVNIIFGKGIDTLADLINVAVDKNVIKKAGAWYSYKEEKIGQGIDSVVEFLHNRGELTDEIYKETSKILLG